MSHVDRENQGRQQLEHRVEIWRAGPPESEIRFSLSHLTFAEIRGRVGRWTAVFVIDPDEPTLSSIEVAVDARSLDTGATERDNHARSSGFLDVARFPEIRFRSRQIHRLPGNDQLEIVGDLVIRDVAREIRVRVERETHPSRGEVADRKLNFVGHASVRRQDFGLRWHEELDRGGGLVAGDRVEIELRIQARPGEK